MTISGVDEVLNNLRIFSEKSTDAAYRAVQRTALASAGYARNKVKSGSAKGSNVHLKQSITSKVQRTDSGVEGAVYTPAPHAQYIEFGTGWPVGHRSYTKRVTKTGKVYHIKGWVYRSREGNFYTTQGQPARPYMRPAKTYAQRLLERELRTALGGIST